MEIVKLVIHNIGPYKDSVYYFNKRQITFLVGKNLKYGFDRNGVGKSWIPDILTWVIWDNTIRKKSKDELIRENTKGGYAFIVIKRNRKKYKIKRCRGINKNKLSFIGIGNNKRFDGNGRTNRYTQENINKVFGDFITFINTSYFGQRKILQFLEGTSFDRCNIITSFFGINIWDNLYKNVCSELNKSNDVVSEHINKIDVWNDICENIDYEYELEKKKKIEEKCSFYKKKINEVSKKLQKAKKYEEFIDNISKLRFEKKQLASYAKNNIVLYDKQISDMLGNKDDISNLKKKMKNIESKKEELEYFTSQKDELDEDRDLKFVKKNKLESKILMLKNNRKKIVDVIDNLNKESVCPTCKRTVDDKTINSFNNEVDVINKKTNKVNDKIIITDEEIDDLENKIGEIDSKMSKIIKFVSDEAVIKERIANVKNSSIKIKELKIDRKNFIINSGRKIKAFNESIKRNVKNAEKYVTEKNYTQLVDDYNVYNNNYSHGKVKANKIKNVLRQYRGAKSKVKELKASIKEKRKLIDVYSYLKYAFPLIKLLIIDDINNLLEKTTNEKLSDMGVNLRLSFTTEVEKKSGDGVYDKYDINVMQNDIIRDISMFGGGEKQRISLAMIFAFNEIASNMNESSNVLILDEVFSGLDNIGKDMCMRIIENNFPDKNIHIITHLSDIEGRFKPEQKVVIEMNESGVSKVYDN